MSLSWIDLVLAAIIIFCACKGFLDGFIKAFLSFFLVIASLIVAKLLSPGLSSYLMQNAGWTSSLRSWIYQRFSGTFAGGVSGEAWTNSLALDNLPRGVQDFINSFVDTTNKGIGSAAEVFADNVTKMIVTILCFIAIFAIAWVLGKLIIAVVNKLAELPVLRVFNKAGGILVGALKGVLLAVLISTLLYFTNLLFAADWLSTAVNNSFLMKYFYIGFLFT